MRKIDHVIRTVFLPAVVVSFLLCAGKEGDCLEVRTDSFTEKGPIPMKYTGMGEDLSPGLFWSDVPEGTANFAVILYDPDAPMGEWVHWVVYGIPARADRLEEGLPKTKVLPGGIEQGVNSFGRIGYNGPLPPPGAEHRYIFTLYALDTSPDVASGADRDILMKAMEGHIIEKTEMSGTFGR
ncbi:MAG: YbhB/YbcL family Raf kinase inhibitor-like protein [Candidatus Omnitrophota bacterium]|nr:YbhB/YbcL family Raf kinase inhibitor-like protein [Candidatus Omnitrophota bacterium]